MSLPIQRAKHCRRPNSPPYLSVYAQSPTNHIKRTYHVWTKQIQLRRINTQEGSVFELDGKEGITSAFSGTKKSRCCSSFQVCAIVRTRFSSLLAFFVSLTKQSRSKTKRWEVGDVIFLFDSSSSFDFGSEQQDLSWKCVTNAKDSEIRPNSLSLSVSHSISNTRTHTHTQTCSFPISHTRTHICYLPISHTLTHTRTHSLSLSSPTLPHL